MPKAFPAHMTLEAASRMQSDSRNYLAFLWHAAFLALTATFTDVNTILPSLVMKTGGGEVGVGIMTAIMVGTPIVAQLLFASYLHLKPCKRNFLLLGINLRAVTLAGVAWLLWNADRMSGQTLILLVMVLIFVFAVAGTFAGVSYTDILGKVLAVNRRGRFFVTRQVLTSLAYLVSALTARHFLATRHYPYNYVWLFALAAGLLWVASWGFWAIDEPSSPVARERHRLPEILRSIPTRLREDHRLRHFILLVNLSGFGLTLMPFYIAMAKGRYGLSGSQVGSYLLVNIAGMILSNFLWAHVVKRFGFVGVVRGCLGCSTALPLLALLLSRGPLPAYLFVFFTIGVAVSARKIAFEGLFLEITTDENRALYKGIVGAMSLTTALVPLVAGGLIAAVGYPPVLLVGSAMVATAFFFVPRPLAS